MQETGTFKAEKIDLQEVDTLDGERKDQFLKRRAKEDREAKKGNTVIAEWYCLSHDQTKLLKRIKKANGGEYTSYLFKIKKDMKLYNEKYKPLIKPFDFEPPEWIEYNKKKKPKKTE